MLKIVDDSNNITPNNNAIEIKDITTMTYVNKSQYSRSLMIPNPRVHSAITNTFCKHGKIIKPNVELLRLLIRNMVL